MMAAPADFELGEALGSGQFGVVHRAVHLPTTSTVALKLCSTVALPDPKLLHRLRQEARVLMLLSHANIVRCFGSIELQTQLCTILAHVPGESLAHIVSREGALDEATAAPIILQVARALRHCHERKVSHRECVYNRTPPALMLPTPLPAAPTPSTPMLPTS